MIFTRLSAEEESMTEVFDAVGVADVFATTTHIESAGGGCIRVYNCIVKDGRLIPVGNAVVFPAACILQLKDSAQEFARKVYLSEIKGAPVH